MMTQDEYDSEMKRICDKHSNEIVYIVNINVLGANVCTTMGHDMHLMIAECVRCYCKEHNISLDRLRACAEDLDRLSETIRMMSQLNDQSAVTPQASNFCNQLLNKLM